MGITYAEIALANAGDIAYFERDSITEEQIRQITVNALVDTSARALVINEAIRQLYMLKSGRYYEERYGRGMYTMRRGI